MVAARLLAANGPAAVTAPLVDAYALAYLIFAAVVCGVGVSRRVGRLLKPTPGQTPVAVRWRAWRPWGTWRSHRPTSIERERLGV